MTAPIHTECTETPHAPCRPSTGMASSVNDASQASATPAQARPAALTRPAPSTRTAPAVTITAASTTCRRGAWRCSSGPSTLSRTGTQATATAIIAGPVCATPRTIAMLNSTRPVAEMLASQSHSRPRGRVIRAPHARARISRTTLATPYRMACAVSSGAATSVREIATLLPTRAMARLPAATLYRPAPPERGAPERGAPEQGAPDRGAPDRGAPDRGRPDRGPPGARIPGGGVPGTQLVVTQATLPRQWTDG